MNTQKGFAPILLILLVLAIISGGYYFYVQNGTNNITENSQEFILGGIWKFEEFSKEKKINGITTPIWEYTLSIDTQDETKGTLSIDGYQTMARLNIKIEKLNDSANIILDSYGDGNQFETYKKGDLLMSIGANSEGNLWIDWYKMQPNIEDNKVGAIFVKKLN